MGKEIERKFLVADVDAAIAASTSSVRIMQGYLSTNPDTTVRVRIRGTQGFITVKSRSNGAERGEWEYEIPVSEARELIDLSVTPIIDKTRYLAAYEGHIWEIDVFTQPVSMVLAEVELKECNESLVFPDWVAEEVTGDSRYYNSNIARG
ncbi:MAG: CYTH domain-containing protein [Bacteroidales bacterium]|nr:CYTH domain-containing protein [Bacteroidales bacterium]